jgi:hypothetical protein
MELFPHSHTNDTWFAKARHKVNVKLSLCLIKYYGIKTCVKVEVQFHRFLTSN